MTLLSDFPVSFSYENKVYFLPNILIGYQMYNFVMALRMYCFITKTDLESIEQSVFDVRSFYRFEQIWAEPVIYADCSHNMDGIRMLFDSLGARAKDFYVLYSGLSDKNPEQIIRFLADKTDLLITTDLDDPRYVGIGAVTARYGNALHLNENFAALSLLCRKAKATGKKGLIFGSFRLINSVMRIVCDLSFPV
jgi:folylpolyglutamate synthase/dihydropteroate synthase